jgi:catechol 2,3-dioxygenase-like lactoylglutathione lyase family enzyme
MASLAFSHVGIWVCDLAAMERFYTRMLGFTVTDRGSPDTIDLVFLSQDPREHHEIVLANGRPRELAFNSINQISLRVDDLAALRAVYHRVRDEGVRELRPVTHGNAISVYFLDPEGNRLEIFLDTPWYTPQPCRAPIDLDQPDRAIWQAVEALCRGRPGFKPRADWEAEMRARMRA